MKSDTDTIEKKLESAESYDEFYKENSSQFNHRHPAEYLIAHMDKKKLNKTDIIAKVNINVGYAYEILRGEKRPGRDKILQFAFALKLSILEIQDLLKRCSYAQLFCKNPRDSVIIFCINRKKSLFDVNMLLHKYNFETL